MRRILAIVGLLPLAAACSVPAAPPAPPLSFATVVPAPGVPSDGQAVVVRALPLVVREDGDHAAAYVEGWLPTPCHRPVADLTVLVPARRASIAVGARMEGGDVCVQVLTPWAKVFVVGSADLARGAWELSVNGREVRVPETVATAASVVIETVERTGSGEGAAVVVSGQLPTPCHVLRLSRALDAAARTLDYRLDAVSDAQVCVQVLEPFRIVLPLAPAGEDWRVRVNDRPAE